MRRRSSILKRLLITGGSGYLGSRLTQRFLRDGWEILCVCLREAPIGYLKPLKDNVQIIYTDNKSFASDIQTFSPELVIHTACRYQRGNIILEDLAEANLSFPLRMLSAVTTRENRSLWINTNTSLDRDLNGYTLAKHQFADWGKYCSRLEQIDFCNILLEQFYGEGDSGTKFVPYLLNRMGENLPIELTDGQQRRDFVYIDDVVNAYAAIVTAHPVGYNEIPVGTGEAPRIREVVEYIKLLTGSVSPLLFGVVPRRNLEPEISTADITALRDMGYVCRYSWQEGLKKTVEKELQ